MAQEDDDAFVTDLDGTDETASLVEIEPGLAVLFGDRVPSGVELVPFSLMPEKTSAEFADAVSTATGIANVAAQGVNGLMQAQGLVRLAPETLKALETARPLASGGWNLGTLASEGKIVAQVRWLPAGGATTASVIASAGPALAMLAIQMQLSEITKLARHNIDLTKTVVQEVRIERLATNQASYEDLVRRIDEARHIGSVPPAVYKEVRGKESNLVANWEAARRLVRTHTGELRRKTGHQERQRYLQDNAEAILADAHALLLAQSAWFMQQSLRAGHLLDTVDDDPRNRQLLEKVVTDARARHEESLGETVGLIEDLCREIGLMAELEGKRTLPVGGKRRAAKDVASVANRLYAALAAMRGGEAHEVRELDKPALTVFNDEAPTELLRVLPYRLEHDERVLALADATQDGRVRPIRDPGWVAVTDRRFLLMKQEDLRRYGSIADEQPLLSIRYVRTKIEARGGPEIDVITKDKDFTLRFGSWAAEEAHQPEVKALGALLGHFMNLPVDELPTFEVEELVERGVLSRSTGEIATATFVGEADTRPVAANAGEQS